MEQYGRMLDDAQRALERRDRAHDELQYVLDDDRSDADRPLPTQPAQRPGKRGRAPKSSTKRRVSSSNDEA